MRLKSRPTDFRVEELLREGCLLERGQHRVYQVTKSKVTSIDAARVLGRLAGVSPGEVAMAGLKDRQGLTRQFMSVPRGKDVHYDEGGLEIHSVGFSAQELSSADSLGNAFRIVVRDLGEREVARLRAALPSVREHGLPNYFDEQRFGNLRHGQGWIVLDLLRSGPEHALRRLLTAVSDHDDRRTKSFKSAMHRHWGDWNTCRDVAGRFGAHHSVFEHMRRNPDDPAGAFHRVATRVRLIHLYAWQSHLWNRALATHLDVATPADERFTLRAREGKLVFPKGVVPLPAEWKGSLPLPGERLDGVELPDQRALFESALGEHGLKADQLVTGGVPGFTLKPEPRAAVIVPKDLRVRPSEPDGMNAGREMVRLSFSLPRGAYATLVLRRLIGPPRPS